VNTPNLIFIAAPVTSAHPTEAEMKAAALAALNALGDRTEKEIAALMGRQHATYQAIKQIKEGM